MGTRPWSRIQPFRAPKAEIIATSAIALPAQPPKIEVAAFANGLADFARSPLGMMPMIATVAMM
jgi:hypothetical protein